MYQRTENHITDTVLKLKDTIENHWGEYDELGEGEDEDDKAKKMKALAEVELDQASSNTSSSKSSIEYEINFSECSLSHDFIRFHMLNFM